MSEIEWTDAEREAIGGHQAVHSSGNWPWGCECGEEFRTSTGHALHVRDVALDALAPHVAAREAQAAAKALREAVEKDAITIPDILGYEVPAVAVEDLLNRADAIDQEDDR